MICPKCNNPKAEVRVVDSRNGRIENSIRRRRSCTLCNHRFTTYEMPGNRPRKRAELRADVERLMDMVTALALQIEQL